MSAAPPFGTLIPFGENSWSRGLPSPYYNESHERVRKGVRDWIEKHDFLTNMHEWSEAGRIPEELYKESATLGIVACMAAGGRIPTDEPYYKGIPLPGGVKPEEWDQFHDLVLIEELHRPDFGA